jgi:hypothetical protein
MGRAAEDAGLVLRRRVSRFVDHDHDELDIGRDRNGGRPSHSRSGANHRERPGRRAGPAGGSSFQTRLEAL